MVAAFLSYSIMITYKILKYVLAFLDVERSRVVVVSEVLGVDFVLASFVLLTGVLFSTFSDFVCHPTIFSSLL